MAEVGSSFRVLDGREKGNFQLLPLHICITNDNVKARESIWIYWQSIIESLVFFPSAFA